jgi:hypothetical protein
MGAADMADGLEVAILGGGEHILHLAAEDGELLDQVQARHHLQPDARGLEIEALADLAQRRISRHRRDLGEEIHVEARQLPIFGLLGELVAARDQRADAVEIGVLARDRREAADQHGELHTQLVDLGELLDPDRRHDMADAVARLDQAFGLEAAEDAAHRRATDGELLGELLLGQAPARRIFEEADAIAQGAVKALEALARGRRARGAARIGARGDDDAHMASRQARRNWRVRSFSGAPKSFAGGPSSQMRPP